MTLSYWIRVAEHLNRPETGDLGEKAQESVCPCRFCPYMNMDLLLPIQRCVCAP